MVKSLSILLVTVALIVGIQCGGYYNEPYDKELLESMADEIYDLIGEANCDDVENCRYIAFGSKPCGGPWEYLTYSISVTDSVMLARKVRAYYRFQDEMNHRYGYASDCSMPNNPILGCVEGACVDIRGQ